jgi:hypothetical protein
MKVQTITIFLAMSLLVGCSKDSGDDAVDADGNCTQQTLNAFNELSRNAKSGSLQATYNSCQQVQSLLGSGKSCTAYSIDKGYDVTVSYSEISSACEKLRQSLQSKPETSSPRVESDEDRIANCTSRDISTINRLSAAAGRFRSDSSYYNLSALKDSCRDMSSTDLKYSLKCKATNTTSGEAKIVEYSEYKKACDKILNEQ